MTQLRIKNSALSAFLDIAYANTVGSAISATPTLTNTGEAFGGRYTLTFPSVSAGVSATATVACESFTFPRNGFSKSVLLDGTTPETALIPGASILFSNSGSFVNTWTSYVDVGDWLGEIDAGTGAGTGVRLAAYNTGSTTLTNCFASINRERAKLWRKAGTGGLKDILVYASGAVEKEDVDLTTLPYAVTFANLNTGVSPNTIDVKIDGALISSPNIFEVDAGTTSSSAALKRDGTTRYRITGGNLAGIEFTILATAANSDTANIIVWENRHIQIAPDVSGSAGTYSSTTDVQLTASGQPAGEIPPAGAAYFWYRTNVTSGASSKKNPHPLDIYLKYSDTGVASITL